MDATITHEMLDTATRLARLYLRSSLVEVLWRASLPVKLEALVQGCCATLTTANIHHTRETQGISYSLPSPLTYEKEAPTQTKFLSYQELRRGNGLYPAGSIRAGKTAVASILVACGKRSSELQTLTSYDRTLIELVETSMDGVIASRQDGYAAIESSQLHRIVKELATNATWLNQFVSMNPETAHGQTIIHALWGRYLAHILVDKKYIEPSAVSSIISETTQPSYIEYIRSIVEKNNNNTQ